MRPHGPPSIARRSLPIALALAAFTLILGADRGTYLKASVRPRLDVPVRERETPALKQPRSLSQSPAGLVPIDVDLPSLSTGSPTGTLAVRVYTPRAGNARYLQKAPVLVWVPSLPADDPEADNQRRYHRRRHACRL